MEWFAGAAVQAAVVEDGGDVAAGVVVEEFVDGSDDLGRGPAGLGAGFGHGQGEAVVLAAAEPHVRGDGVGGPGHGDVGEQQPGDALAFVHGGGGVVPEGGQVGGELGDPVFLGAGECAGVLLAGLVVGGLGVVQFPQRGVPVCFEGVGDEPVGGVDGQVAAAGQVGVVAGAFDVGGAQRVGFGGGAPVRRSR